jgi:hypothetical protein
MNKATDSFPAAEFPVYTRSQAVTRHAEGKIRWGKQEETGEQPGVVIENLAWPVNTADQGEHMRF